MDAINLYGWAMSEPLPIGGMRWWTLAEVKQLNEKGNLAQELLAMDSEGSTGYWVTIKRIHIRRSYTTGFPTTRTSPSVERSTSTRLAPTTATCWTMCTTTPCTPRRERRSLCCGTTPELLSSTWTSTTSSTTPPTYATSSWA